MKERTDAVRAARKKFYALRARHKKEERRAREEWNAAALEQIRLAETGPEIAGFFRSLPYADGSSVRCIAFEKLLNLCDSVDKIRVAYRKCHLYGLGSKWDALSLAEVEAATTTVDLVCAAKRSRRFRDFGHGGRSLPWFAFEAAIRKFLLGCKNKEECAALGRTFDIGSWIEREGLRYVADNLFWERLKELGWDIIREDRSRYAVYDEDTGRTIWRPYFFLKRE